MNAFAEGFGKDSRDLLQCPALAAQEWLEHGFGTRHSPLWASSRRSATLKQIHSDVVVTARERTGCLGEGDALVTASPGVLLTVRTADCVPILIADPGRRAVAAIHAGWRGTAQCISLKTVRKLMEEFHSVPGELIAAVGPSIGGCCYEVGPEVVEQLQGWLAGPPAAGKALVDLVSVNLEQLTEAGVPRERIFCARVCTKCTDADFHSFRRDNAAAGRMESAICING